MIKELEAALVQAVDNLKGARERLRTIPGPGGAFAGCAALAVRLPLPSARSSTKNPRPPPEL